MRLRSAFRPRPLAVIWTGLCLILMLVGFATLTSQPSGNGDLLSAAASPALSDGEIAADAAVLWLFGVVPLLAFVGARRLSRALSRDRPKERER
jgi:hypothetical protein